MSTLPENSTDIISDALATLKPVTDSFVNAEPDCKGMANQQFRIGAAKELSRLVIANLQTLRRLADEIKTCSRP